MYVYLLICVYFSCSSDGTVLCCKRNLYTSPEHSKHLRAIGFSTCNLHIIILVFFIFFEVLILQNQEDEVLRSIQSPSPVLSLSDMKISQPSSYGGLFSQYFLAMSKILLLRLAIFTLFLGCLILLFCFYF